VSSPVLTPELTRELYRTWSILSSWLSCVYVSQPLYGCQR